MVSIMSNRVGHRGYDVIPEHPLERLRPLRVESNRRKTFNDWSGNFPIKPEDLIRDGFYYMGMSDKVQCAYCGGVLSGFEHGDKVHEEHARHFPKCPHLNDIESDDAKPQDVFNDIEEDAAPRSDPGDDAAPQDPNQPDCSQPFLFGNTVRSNASPQRVPELKHPKYSTYQSRLESYEGWPENHFLKPQDLAAANLFYKGVEDKCQCYICGGILEAWEEGDVPADEHKRWFIKCGKN